MQEKNNILKHLSIPIIIGVTFLLFVLLAAGSFLVLYTFGLKLLGPGLIFGFYIGCVSVWIVGVIIFMGPQLADIAEKFQK